MKPTMNESGEVDGVLLSRDDELSSNAQFHEVARLRHELQYLIDPITGTGPEWTESGEPGIWIKYTKLAAENQARVIAGLSERPVPESMSSFHVINDVSERALQAMQTNSTDGFLVVTSDEVDAIRKTHDVVSSIPVEEHALEQRSFDQLEVIAEMAKLITTQL